MTAARALQNLTTSRHHRARGHRRQAADRAPTNSAHGRRRGRRLRPRREHARHPTPTHRDDDGRHGGQAAVGHPRHRRHSEDHQAGRHRVDGAKITADSMTILENGKVLVFETRAVHIEPGADEDHAQADRGGADAQIRNARRRCRSRARRSGLALCGGRRPRRRAGRSREPPVRPEASRRRADPDRKRQAGSASENENIAIFTGNVNVVQGPTLLKAGKMTVFYAKERRFGGRPARPASTGSRSTTRSTSSRTSRSPPATAARST